MIGEVLAGWLRPWCYGVMTRRGPDFEIGEPGRIYMRRWWIIPRNPIFNIYLHRIQRSDDDRALHDHPWWNISLVIDQGYIEHLKPKRYKTASGWEHWVRSRRVGAGQIVARFAKTRHRLELVKVEGVELFATTLFITGPKFRAWGFYCPQGWVHWKKFVSFRPGGNSVGRGCDQ